MTVVDVIAGEPHFVDHLAPIWLAMGQPGTFYTRGNAATVRAAHYGFTATEWAGQPGDLTLVASFGDLHRAHSAGRRLVLMEHGAGFTFNVKHPSYAGGSHPSRDAVELFLTPGPRTADKLRAAHPATPVVEIGCPKLDHRISRSGALQTEPPTVVFSFHWDCKVAPETRWAFPHFARAIARFARNPNYRVAGHAHPRAAARLTGFYKKSGIPFLPTFDDVLDVASVYVCDASSTIYEAAACGIPVVLLNAPYYRRDVEHGLRFWEAANVGPQVDHPGTLRAGIDAALNPTPEQMAETARCLNLVYTHRDGTSTARAVDAIRSLL